MHRFRALSAAASHGEKVHSSLFGFVVQGMDHKEDLEVYILKGTIRRKVSVTPHPQAWNRWQVTSSSTVVPEPSPRELLPGTLCYYHTCSQVTTANKPGSTPKPEQAVRGPPLYPLRATTLRPA